MIETERLILRQLTIDDAAFILELVNDPDWLRFIGDRGVRTLDDARNYILNGPLAMYERAGFGMYLVELKSDGVSAEDRVLLANVYRVLDRVPTAERVAWSLRYVEGVALDEVARLCECSLATAKRRIAAAQAQIHEELGDG